MKKFGFGCMRLPMKEDLVDTVQFKRMIDKFIEDGFNYFDTAHGYIHGLSETAIKECLVDRYARDKYILTDKLTSNYFNSESDIYKVFSDQLEATGVSYFDYYLMHALNSEYYKKFVNCRAFEAVKQLKNEGKVRHMGISFHDKPEVLEMILTQHPEIEVVQIQFNYLDYDNPIIQSRAVYDVCRKFNKPIIVMEPCKGGGLINIPDKAKKIYDELGNSYANYAIRYCASFDSIFMVLSGMSTYEQLVDNVAFMKDFKPFIKEEYTAVEAVKKLIKKQDTIACTACRYCVDGCPKNIMIPDIFACYNAQKQYKDWNSNIYYSVSTNGKGKASDCIECGQCEAVCPQHLPIRKYLKEVVKALEK